MNPKSLPRALLLASLAGAMYRAEGEVVGSAGAAPTVATPPVATTAPEAPNAYVEMKKQNFHFKKEKDTVGKDENGKDVVLQAGTKHPTVELYLPVPKDERLVEFLQDAAKYPKEVELIRSAIFDVIYGVARGQINEFRDNEANKGQQVSQSVLNFDKLDFTAIANTPRAERGAYAPSDDEMKAFLDSYLEVMPAATGKKQEIIKNHVLLFQGGFKKQKGQKDILEMMNGQLAIYFTSAPADAQEENLQVVEYFTNKLERWIKAEEKITMNDL